MAFNAKLNFGGKEFDVLDCNYSLKRDVDPKGRPASNIYGGEVTVHVESTEDTSILQAMCDEFKPNTGTVVFKKGNEEAKMKELSWENGYIIAFKEHIDVVGSRPMSLTFTVSAQTLKIGEARIEQNWPDVN